MFIYINYLEYNLCSKFNTLHLGICARKAKTTSIEAFSVLCRMYYKKKQMVHTRGRSNNLLVFCNITFLAEKLFF